MKRIAAFSLALAAALIVIAPAGAAGAGEAAAPAAVLTLDEALRVALANNPEIEKAGIEVDKVGDDLSALRTRQYPSFRTRARATRNFTDESFSVQEGQFGTVVGVPVPSQPVDIETKEDISTSVELEVRQPLAQLYKIGLKVDSLEVDQQISGQKLRGKQQEIASDVKQSYYNALKSQSALRTAEASIAFYTSLVEIVGNKVKEQAAYEYELLDSQARLASAQHDAFKERNSLANEKARLNQLMGRDIDTPFSVAPLGAARPIVPDPKLAESQALVQRPETRGARLQLERAELERQTKVAEYIPDVDFKASYVKLGSTKFIPDDLFYVGIELSWEFFDWGRRSDEVRKAIRSIAEAKNDIRQAEHQVLVQVNERIRDLENALNLVHVTELAQAAAKEKLRVTMNRYKEEAALLDDVLDAESKLAQANGDYQEATLSVLSAAAELDKALGEE